MLLLCLKNNPPQGAYHPIHSPERGKGERHGGGETRETVELQSSKAKKGGSNPDNGKAGRGSLLVFHRPKTPTKGLPIPGGPLIPNVASSPLPMPSSELRAASQARTLSGASRISCLVLAAAGVKGLEPGAGAKERILPHHWLRSD